VRDPGFGRINGEKKNRHQLLFLDEIKVERKTKKKKMRIRKKKKMRI
jgi:hypothetical protein